VRKRAVITGIGLVTPVGTGVEEFWDALTAGHSGIGPITLFDTTGFAVQIGGEVKDVDFGQYIPPELSRKMSRASKLAVVAARLALNDSGLEIRPEERDHVDVYVGTACPDIETISQNGVRRYRRGAQGVSPLMPAFIVPSGPTGNISMVLGLPGESLTVSTACSSSTNAVGHALRRIQSGASEVIFAGGTDAGVQAELVATYANADVLSTRNGEPTRASRPFEARRDGHVLSEAAAILVLEELEHARRRDAHVYAEVAGYASTSDCGPMAAVCPDETRAAQCIDRTLKDAARNPDEVDLYCAHGTSSQLTDARETRMLKRALDERAYAVPVTGIKSMTGHPFGASGALQAATCALAIEKAEIPPTINYDEADPDCDLDYVPNQARAEEVDLALCYSLGMGNNAALALAAC
jgi:3-oxoacyl-[acyl-carrier-protein] synthase II